MSTYSKYSLIAVLFLILSCKGKNSGEKTGEQAASTQTTSSDAAATPLSETKTYAVVSTPDSVVLGKSREAFVRILGVSAVALQDPDGKDNGMELVVRLQLTNRMQIGQGSMIHVDYPESRLALDNGNNITCTRGSGFLTAEPEATSKEESWTYQLPAGTKPKALNLFMDGTRVSVGLMLK